MNKVRLFLNKNKKFLLPLFFTFYVVLGIIWLPGLGATIMMSDSFVMNDPRIGYLSILLFTWGVIPFSIIASLFLYVWKRDVVYCLIPLVNLLIFVVLFFMFPFIENGLGMTTKLNDAERHDLDLMLSR